MPGVYSSQHARNPELHPGAIGGVVGAKNLYEPRLIAEHAGVKPDRARGEQDQREPRPEGDHEPEHEDEVPEIHRIARVAIRSLRDDPLRRHGNPGPAARKAEPIAADQQVLQIAPDEKQATPWHNHRPAAMAPQL